MENSFGNRLKNALKYRGVSQKDLADKLNVDKSTITRYIKNEVEVGNSRTYAIANILNINIAYLFGLTDSIEPPTEIQQIPSNNPFKHLKGYVDIDLSDTVKIPVVSSIPASFNKTSELIYDEYINYPKSLLQYSDYKQRYIAMNVEGYSMYPDLYPGDRILVDTKLELNNGDIGAFYFNDEYTVKRIYFEPNRIIFKPTNPEHPEKSYSKKELHEMGYHQIGKVVKIVERKL